MKICEAYANQTKKMRKIAKMQKEAYDLTEQIGQSKQKFNSLAENTMVGLVSKKIDIGLKIKPDGGYNYSERSVVVYPNGIGLCYGNADERASQYDTYKLVGLFREHGKEIVKGLENQLPDGKVEIYKKIAKSAKKMWGAGSYERKLGGQVVVGLKNLVVGENEEEMKANKDEELNDEFSLEMGNYDEDENSYHRAENGKQYLKVKNKDYHLELSLYGRGISETLYRYFIIEQVYGESVKLLRKAINDKKKRLKHNEKELEKLKDGVAGYLALKEL